MRIFQRILPVLLFVFCVVGTAHAKPTLTEMVRQIVCDCSDCGKQTIDQCMATCSHGKGLAEEVRQQIEQGKNADQILEYMSATHGEKTLAVPHQDNFWGRMGPLAPFLIMLVGIVPITYITRTRHRKVKIVGPKKAPQKIADDDERLNEALKRFDY